MEYDILHMCYVLIFSVELEKERIKRYNEYKEREHQRKKMEEEKDKKELEERRRKIDE